MRPRSLLRLRVCHLVRDPEGGLPVHLGLDQQLIPTDNIV